MITTWASKISAILSPTSSYIACMSNSAARPCWTLLMIASSAARSLLSASRRFVSSNRRTFSSATLREPASVVSSRTSAGPKASNSSMLWMEITPVFAPPPLRGTNSALFGTSPLSTSGLPYSAANFGISPERDSGSPVSRTCLRKPTTSIGPMSSRAPRSAAYGKWSSPDSGCRTLMLMLSASKISRILSPTRSYISCMSNRPARPS